jgi:uncharacterized protein Yka (UPF0111/DUF47 family)
MMEMLDIEVIKGFLGEAAKSSLSEKLIVAGIIWHFVSKKFSKHFEKIETSLTSLSKNLGELNESIVRIEKSHAGRIGHLEERVEKLEKD